MLSRSRMLLSFNRNVISTLESPDQSVFVRLVRWRMRRWAPTNPSKLFYVRQPTPIDAEEWTQLRDAYSKYSRRVRAIRRLFLEEMKEEEATRMTTAMKIAEEKEWVLHLQANDEWNQETATIREAHRASLEQEEEEKRFQRMVELEELETAQRERAARLVQQQQEEAKHFVTMDNLEEEIEKAINLRVNYNFAIDDAGNRYIEQSDGSIVQEGEEAMDKDQTDVSKTEASGA